MTKLAQIIAVETGVKEGAAAAVAQAQAQLRSDPSAFSGMARSHEYHEGWQHLPARPDERVNVKVVAEDVLAQLAADLTRLFDVTLTKETADATAKADVVVTIGGHPHTLIEAAPVTYLLFLEKQCDRLAQRVINAQLPLEDPSTIWQEGDAGVRRTAEYQVPSTTRQRHNWVKAEAVVEGSVGIPAQVEVFEDSTVTGHWDTVRYSGALSPARVRTLMERLAEFKRAVVSAREEANGATITDRKAGQDVFSWLLR